ncbi:hypothetical protein [Symbioplanes lichenis]|uniref:hypothetical protein n=1 Tax=Symbioplanes lichenis TaxID=1629072 RepID=UPI002739C09D|nr:hypothetical protein [Actinoplanes lichenis]
MALDEERFAALHRSAVGLGQRLAAAATAAAAPTTGSDDTGCVTAEVRADDQPVTIRLAGDWREAVGARALGRAVVTALTNASAARLTAWAGAMTAHSTPAADSAAPAPAIGAALGARATPGAGTILGGADPGGDGSAGGALGDPGSRQSGYAQRDLIELILQVGEQFPAAAAAAEAAARQVTATSATGTVRATATGGIVTAVDCDEEWAARVPEARLAAALTEAVNAVRRRAAEERDRARPATPALDRLRRLTDTPEELWRETGLLR